MPVTSHRQSGPGDAQGQGEQGAELGDQGQGERDGAGEARAGEQTSHFIICSHHRLGEMSQRLSREVLLSACGSWNHRPD